MKRRPEGERRQRRRYHPVRTLVVGAWCIVAIGSLVASHGAFWRDVGYWMDRAVAHAEAREWSQALHNVGRALDGAPTDPGILTFAGHMYGALEQWPDAAQHFERALDEDAGRPEAVLGLAEARLAMGEDAAAALALGGLRVPDADPRQRVRAAGLAELSGRADIALELFESFPSVENRLERARLARAVGQYERELELLEEAWRDGVPEGAATHALLRTFAVALENAGRTDDAVAAYEALYRDGLLDADTGVRYAWILNEAGRHEHALAVLEASPPTPEVHALAVRSAIWADDLTGARAHLSSLPDGAALTIELRGALGDAEARRARATAMAAAARLRSAPPTDPADALDFWRGRLAADASDGGARAEVVALLEADGRFAEARTVLEAGPDSDPAHLARLSLWAGRPEDAVVLLGSVPAGELDRASAEVLAEALLATGDAEGAYRTLTAVDAAASPVSPLAPPLADGLLLRARVTDAAGRPGEAAEHLASVARVRDLTVDEREWWAGLLWRSGGLEGALAGYEGLVALRPDDAGLHRSIGDLRMALDDPAGAELAYGRVLELNGVADPAARGLALALIRQGRTDEAVTIYDAYLAEMPDDTDARLGLARALAESGAFVRSAEEYERYAEAVDGQAPAGAPLPGEIASEIASVWMALGDFERAEPWARQEASAPDAPFAQLRLAHLLALLDRHDASAEVVDRVVEARHPRSDLENALIDAWIFRLRGRPLAALQALDGQVGAADTTGTARAAWIFLAEVSEARGDVADARRQLIAADAAGARPGDMQHVTTNLEARARTHAAAGAEVGSDANRLDVATGWARVGLRPASGLAPALSAEVRHRRASQLDATGNATAFSVGGDSLFVSRTLMVDGRLGVEASADGGARLLGGIGGTLETLAGHRWSLDASREPVWAEGRRTGAPEYGRVRDLGALDPELMVNELRLAFSTTPANPLGGSIHVEAAASGYSDGNRRTYGYGEVRLPLTATSEGRVALIPNGYAEGFGSERLTYASPSHFLALGLAADGERRLGERVTLGARANPHYFRFAGTDGLGLEGRLWMGIDTGAGAVRFGARYLQQGDLYDLFRLSTEVALPLRGAR